jgi:hypothetical protein
MSCVNETDYYRRRAAQERALAQSAASPSVQRIHDDMAVRYAELAQGAGEPRRPELGLAG